MNRHGYFYIDNEFHVLRESRDWTRGSSHMYVSLHMCARVPLMSVFRVPCLRITCRIRLTALSTCLLYVRLINILPAPACPP